MPTATESTELPYLTADLPGVGGEFKRFDEDFVVEELPLYPACGTGTHVYFTVEKRGLTTPAAIQMIARALGRKPGDIGYAGLKDAHGITRQRFSLEHVEPARLAGLSLNRIRVLDIERHGNKIKLGHLAGNGFTIKIRSAAESPSAAAGAILDALSHRGVPNYFGPQRFGARGDNAAIGRAVLRDDYAEAIALVLGRPGPADRDDIRRARTLFDAGNPAAAADAWPANMRTQIRMCRQIGRTGCDAKKAWRSVDHTLRRLYLSAVQSELFNRVLARRIGVIDRVLAGDLAFKHENGACFRVEDPETEQARCDRFEISPTGPIFGRRMTDPSGEPGELETVVLRESGLARAQIRARDGTKLDGGRRPLRVPLADAELDVGEDERGRYLLLKFTLPAGSYATSVIREICKPRP